MTGIMVDACLFFTTKESHFAWSDQTVDHLVNTGMFSVMLIAAVVLFFNYNQSLFIRDSWPWLSFALFVSVQGLFYSSFVTLAIKNPGAKSQPKSIQYVEETM